MKFWVWSSSILSVLVLFALLINELGHEDNHRTNFRYLTWKRGQAPMDYHWCLHLFFADQDLHQKMQGKSMTELRQWFPETGPAKPGTWQADWLTTMSPKPNISYEQIGSTSIAIQLKDRKFDFVFPMKG